MGKAVERQDRERDWKWLGVVRLPPLSAKVLQHVERLQGLVQSRQVVAPGNVRNKCDLLDLLVVRLSRQLYEQRLPVELVVECMARPIVGFSSRDNHGEPRAHHTGLECCWRDRCWQLYESDVRI